MPRDSQRTFGKQLALSFWEDSAILEQMAASIPTVSADMLRHPFLHVCTWAVAADYKFFAPSAVQGTRPHPWIFPMAENLILDSSSHLCPVPQEQSRG